MKSPRRSTYPTMAALLLALILLAGLVVLILPTFQIPVPAFIPTQVIAAGSVGLLLLALIGYFVRRHLMDWSARRQESREVEIRPEALAMTYRHKLMAQLRQLKVMDVAGTFDLETSYIPLRVREKTRLYFDRDEVAALSPFFPPTREEDREGGETLSPQEALVRFRRLALLGEPGAGKTTLLRYLAFQAAQGELGDLPDFPIFISLGHFAAAAPQSNLLDFIIREIDALYSSPALRSYLEERLEEGSVLLLLDGLDETSVGRPQEARASYRHVVGQINVLSARYPKTPVVVTSRWAGWKGLLSTSFHILEVVGVEQEDVQRFIEDWFGRGRSSRSLRGSDLAWKLQSSISPAPQTWALAANPLLLSLMAFVFKQDGELPEGQTGPFASLRAGLYRRGMELLLEKWETHRGRQRISRFTAEHQRDLLEEVALHFHFRRLSCFPADDLNGIIASYLSAVGLPADWAPAALERLCAQYGLLREQAPRWYSFPHLTWQEYFAAAAISKRGQLKLALEGIPDWWWEGTILFLAEMLEDATPLLEGILDREDDVFRSNLLLAGRCLTRKPSVRQAGLQESIIERLQELVEGDYHLPLRQQAISVLAKIGDPSIAAYFMSLVTAFPFSSTRRVKGTEGEDWTVHRWIATALASLGDESIAANLMALLPDQGVDIGVRTNVAAALGSVGDKSLIPQFLALLPDEGIDYRVRMAVAEALGALSIRPEPYPERRGSRKDDSVIPHLLRLLPNEKIDYRVRVRVAEILGALGDESITSQLLRLLSNEKVDYNVRMSVAETLGALGDRSISGRLLAILDKKKLDPDVRASIAAALGPLGDKSVIPQLMRFLSDEKIDPPIRWKIIDALGALGAMDDEATIPDFLNLLADEKIDSSVRVSVAEALGEKTVTPRLPTPIPVGREATEALRSPGDRSKIPQLLALLPDRELDRSVRLKIVEALGALGDDRITVESLAALLDDEEIGSDVYQALFLVSQRIGVRVFARGGGGYEVR